MWSYHPLESFTPAWCIFRTSRATFCRNRVSVSFEALAHMPVHAFTCSAGILTLGSAEPFAKRPLRKAHRSTDVEHVPAAISPDAFAMLALALLGLEGAMPTAVKP